MRTRVVESLQEQCVEKIEALEGQATGPLAALETQLEALPEEDEEKRAEVSGKIVELRSRTDKAKQEVEQDTQVEIDDVESIRPLMLLTEARYRDLNDRFGEVFKAGMGAEATLQILKNLDLDQITAELENEVRTTSGQRRKKAVKRIRVVEAFRRSSNKSEWMVITMLPVLPPDLRPMVQLDGGRFATSDLNDLYRRVINRNNRLRRLLDLGAPEIIVRNEKRMLQEAVDDLIDNGRADAPSSAATTTNSRASRTCSGASKAASVRTCWASASTMAGGPSSSSARRSPLGECGLPKKMALELFKPFVMNRLVSQGLAHNIKSAKRIVERSRPEVWDILEEVIKGRPVLLNRAPTLHRLGIQAFMPVLVEGSAIQLHPLVCAAFNADFDGDQMAVHLPLSREAVHEARNVMLSVNNMLSPSSGEPLVAPTYEIVLGCYYLTIIKEGAKGHGKRFRDFEDVMVAFDSGLLELQSSILVRDHQSPSGWMETSPGRIVFSEAVPEDLRQYDTVMDKKALKELVTQTYREHGNAVTASVLDRIKEMGFHYATISGTTIGITDIQVPPEKAAMLSEADRHVEVLEDQYEQGLINDHERYSRTIAVWQG